MVLIKNVPPKAKTFAQKVKDNRVAIFVTLFALGGGALLYQMFA